METPPPLQSSRQVIDAEHLKLLAIFHYVMAGFFFIGLGFVLLHYLFFSTIFDNPVMWQNASQGQAPPKEIFVVFKLFYAFFGGCLVLAAVGNLLSGLYLQARKNRVFSFIIAALNCLHMPFGTVLGVFTIVVLVRDSVRDMYETSASLRETQISA